MPRRVTDNISITPPELPAPAKEVSRPKFDSGLLLIKVVVFLCGAGVMILEMVGVRILAPYLGSSLVVWTSLIGIILASLSFGNWWGGRLADKNPNRQTLAIIILLSAIFVALVAVTKAFILALLRDSGQNLHLTSVLATLILFAPPSLLLGMVSPYAIRLTLTAVENSGRIAGTLYALSTVGSIAGTFFAGFFLIAYVGSTNLLLYLAGGLALVSVLTSTRHLPVKLVAVVLLLISLPAAWAYDRFLSSMDFYDLDTDYNRIMIYNARETLSGRKVRIMTTNPQMMQAARYLDNSTDLVLEYTKYFKLAAHFSPQMRQMLVLGGGGYSFPQYVLANYSMVNVDVVEIDPQVTELARRFFNLPESPRLMIYHEDGRTFLNRPGKQYDVILGDVFNSHFSIPFHLTTVETMKKIYSRLPEDGLLLINVIAGLEGPSSHFLRAELATVKSVFPQVFLIPVGDSPDKSRVQNVILAAFKSRAPRPWTSPDPELNRYLSRGRPDLGQPEFPVLTDEFAPVDRYTLAW